MATSEESIASEGQLTHGGWAAARTNRLVERLSEVDQRQLARALGWFSVGLGVVQVLAPRSLGRFIGAGENHAALMRLCGVREIASGMGLLSERAPASSAISRVAGDAMDLALLGAALRSPDAQPARLLGAATAVMGVMAVDVYAAGRHTRNGLAEGGEEVPVKASLAINSPAQKLYDFWRDFENLPRFMERLQSVTRKDETTSHWVAKAPVGGMSIEWDSEIVEDQPGSHIAWRTLPGSQVRHQGSVLFEPAGTHGCIVHVEMQYAAPGGKLGAIAARILGEDPELQIRRDLRALKQFIETGEVATTRGQPSGARSLLGRTLTRREA
jgi:uncharacterized membrane protein